MSDDVIHVLSIEDNPADALLIQEKLSEAQRVGWNLPHFEIEHVARLQAALDRLSLTKAGGTSIDVVLSDLDLPDSQAEETVATLRDHIPTLPLVVLTGREDEALARKSVRVGVQDYLYKNEATGSLLVRALMYAIERQQIHAELERRVAERTAETERSKRVAERERDIAERYLNIAPSIIIATDTEGHITLLNEMGADILECEREAAIGRNWFTTFIPERARGEVKAVFDQLMRGDVQPVSHVENVVLTGAGHERIIHWHNTLLRDPQGEITGLLSSGEDITVQRETLAQLRQSEAKYRQLVETLNEGVWAIDAEGITTFVNPRMAEILGYTEEEMLGRHLFTFMDEAGIEKAKRRLARRRQGQREQHEFEFVRQDGGRINVLMGTSPLMDADGHYQGALASVTDITARKEAERALQRNEARFRAVFEQAAAGIAVALPNGRIVEVNEKLCEILGYSREDLRGRTVHDLTFAQDREKEEQDVQEVLAGKKDEFSVEKRYVHQQGHTIWADVSSNVVRDEHGNIRFVIGVIVDITKRKRVEAQLAQYAADLARSNEEDKR